MPVAKTWSDLDLNFLALPNTGALSIKRDSVAIVRSVQNLILTNFYERKFTPDLGCHLRDRLFDPITRATTLRIRDDIQETLTNYEPRIDLTEIRVKAIEKENGYLIFLKFFIINEEVERTVEFFMERLR